MSDSILHISSVSQIHELMGYAKPSHPLITLINASDFTIPGEYIGTRVMTDLYMISLKDKSCGLDYGRNSFDFQEGVLIFTAPGQLSTINKEVKAGDIEGWMLYFHSDLIRGTNLGNDMDGFTFFNYDVYEALHLSEEEEGIVTSLADQIKREYSQRIDDHTRKVLVAALDLLLSHCMRFYERQFNTRAATNSDTVTRFTYELNNYFQSGRLLEDGIPKIEFFAEKVHLSPHYFSDLLKKETGRSAKDHINDFLVEKAKHLLLKEQSSVSEIAYDLGFNYPHYFTRLFKSKTGMTPVQYRNSK